MSLQMSLRTRSQDSGFALVSTLLALALLTTVGVSLLALGTVEVKSSANHRSATRALLLADAGATHAAALMRGLLSVHEYTDILVGDDGVAGTADDGVLDGFGLYAVDALPDTGVVLGQGRYFVQVVNDAADPSGDPKLDSNSRLVVQCRGEADDGGVADVAIAIAFVSFPAIVSNGNLNLPGNPHVLGPCAGLYVNGALQVSGTPTVDGEVMVSGSVTGGGTIIDAGGQPVTPETGVEPLELPQYNPLDYCDEADYVLRDGWVITVGPPRDSAFAGSDPVLGWDWDPGNTRYILSGNSGVPGTVCVYGNVNISGNPGEDGNPLLITILATGSVEISGNPRIKADHSENILIMASGDLKISGNPLGITDNYAGVVYGGAQCMVNGNPSIEGQLLCYDGPDPAGALNLVDEVMINGNPTFTYDCSGQGNRAVVTSWWESRAQ